MSKFKTHQGLIIDDLKEYVKKWLENKSNIKVYVGCDSQVHGKTVSYAVSVCMYEKGKGGHIINMRTTEPHNSTKVVKKKGKLVIDDADNQKRLFSEVYKSIDVANEIKDIGVPIVIHVDFNSDKEEYSNILHDSGVGYAISEGFEAEGKPFAWAASKAADKAVR